MKPQTKVLRLRDKTKPFKEKSLHRFEQVEKYKRINREKKNGSR